MRIRLVGIVLTVFNLAAISHAATGDGLVAYYKEDAQTHTDSAGTYNGSLARGTTTLTTGKLGQAHQFNGNGNDSDPAISSTFSAVGSWQAATVSAWVRATTFSARDFQTVWQFPQQGGNGHRWLAIDPTTRKVRFRIGTGTAEVEVQSAAALTDNVWYHLVAIWNRTTNAATLYVNNSTPVTVAVPAWGTLTNDFFWGSGSNGFGFRGSIDEIGVWNRALTAQEITELYNSGNALTYPFATTCQRPTITTQPTATPATVNSGGNASVTVTATGTGPLTYQWYKGQTGDNTQPVSGGTQQTLSLTNITSNATYWVRVSNTCGPTESQAATIAVSALPSFTLSLDATSGSVVQGGSATYIVRLTSRGGFSGSVTLQAINLPTGYSTTGSGWNGSTATALNVALNGSASASLTVKTTSSTPPGAYTFQVWGTGNANTQTANATLSVTAPARGTIQVTTNITGASYALNGPTPATGTVSKAFSGMLTGDYTISYNPVTGYNTPPSEKKTLTPGGTIAFSGSYTTGLSATPGSLSFRYQVGTKPPIPAQALSVTAGTQRIPFQVTKSASWLNIARPIGNTPDSIIVTVNDGLPAGRYTGTITVNAGSSGTKVIQVSLDVSPTAVVPNVAKPGTGILSGPIDRSLPTIVLTHGLQKKSELATPEASLWTGNVSPGAGALLRRQYTNVNIIQYIWHDAFTNSGLGTPTCGEYRAARDGVTNAANLLANQLKTILGSAYQQPIQFIGHSLGTIVNAYALQQLDLPGLRDVQFTALDRPHHVGIIGTCRDADGFDSDFFASVLDPSKLKTRSFQLYLDNYFVSDVGSNSGVGDVAASPARAVVYNHRYSATGQMVKPRGLVDPGYLGLGVIEGNSRSLYNDHSGVHEWYRWTIIPVRPPASSSAYAFPNGGVPFCSNPADDYITKFPMNLTLDPCSSGWSSSVINPQGRFRPSTSIQPTTLRGTYPVTDAEPGTACSVGGTTGVSQIISCTTGTQSGGSRTAQSEDEPATVRIELSPNTRYLSFHYVVTAEGRGDFASVSIDNTPIWILEGDANIENESKETGLIPASGFPAGQHQLTVAIHQVSDVPFAFSIEQLQLHDAETFPVHFSANPPGSGSVTVSSNSEAVVPGTTITWSIEATPGFRFAGFTGSIPAFPATFSMVVNAPVEAVANFVPIGTPIFTSQATTNAASFEGNGITPGGLSTIFGVDLTTGRGETVAKGAPWPTALGGVTVTVNGIPAPLYAVVGRGGPDQISFQTPYELEGQASATVVISSSNGKSSGPITVPVLPEQPGIFLNNGVGIVVHSATNELVSATSPAREGEYLVVYATGLGPVENTPESGQGASPLLLSPTVKPVGVSIGGVPARVLYAGLTPGYPGLYQVNIEVPSGIPSGVQSVAIVADQKMSLNANVAF